ncbi:MAG: sulfatase-like hydrolase/transferase [Chloroflexota bacterium]
MTQAVKNILFIMCDQLRADYLSCYGHPRLQTPHIDRLAKLGMRFERAYVQSPICGPSRMCMYTGRYISTHGATLNYAPLPVSEWTLGDYMQELDVRTAVSGKSHVVPNTVDLKRLNIPADSQLGQHLAEGGFEPYFRDDGIHPDVNPDRFADYNKHLREQGYNGHNPWHKYAHGFKADGQFRSGWFMENSSEAAEIPEELSETAVTTTQAINFIKEATAAEQQWCLHLSYIKPHWPFMASEPYNDMFSAADVLPANRHPTELEEPHPVIAAFMRHADSEVYTRPNVRETVIPTYMGLIKQIDDEIGRLLAFLEENNLLDSTLIVFTSDHGDYLGDHWLGEKDLFHEPSVRVPLIVVDPSPAANATRGTVEQRLVETIDLLPTFIDALGGHIPEERLEGRSLLPLLRGETVEWRSFVVSEIDYAFRKAREWLDLPPSECRATMLRTDRWKYIHYENFRPQLFDLENDPNELIDLGAGSAFESVRVDLEQQLFRWFRRRKTRTTLSDEQIKAMFGGWNQIKRGIYVGYWSPDDVPAAAKGM